MHHNSHDPRRGPVESRNNNNDNSVRVAETVREIGKTDKNP